MPGDGKVGNYKGADEEYRQLKAWLSDKGIHTVAFVYAASLGVALGWRLFMDPAFEVHCAWFDGVALSKNAGFAEWFMKRLFRARKKSLAKTRVEASPNLVNMLPKAELVIRPGYAHCGYMEAETKTYVEQIEAFLEQKEKK
ncbi:MAG: hypothetical protein IJ860_03090 [Eubacterium sp.]|nr:hypothetical protein [Eubacterium sp.]